MKSILLDQARWDEAWDEDRVVLTRLRRNGDVSDVTRPVDVSFRGDLTDLQRVAEASANWGFEVLELIEKDEDGKPWLFLVRPQKTDDETMREMAITYLQIEDAFSVRCDGWGCLATNERGPIGDTNPSEYRENCGGIPVSGRVANEVERAKATLDLIRDEGSDLTVARHVVYFLYGDDLDALAEELRSLGLQVHRKGDEQYWHVDKRHRSIAETGRDVEWLVSTDCLMADRSEIIDEPWRTSTLRDLYLLAEKHNAIMDGWHAQLD